MKIQTPFAVVPKYFNNFQNYFNKTDEELVSYTYVPEYLNKDNEKEVLIKNY
tara:strand:+ start:217 stop:372 length:156 start_codon:yes stop_codon:yes gene_type:complete